MKKSSSDISVVEAKTQKLRAQVEQLLPSVTAVLTDLSYYELSHQRISQQFFTQEQFDRTIMYEGLTRGKHLQFGCVMIKWSLSSDSDDNVSNVNNLSANHLSHEVAVLNALNTAQQFQKNPMSIVPALLNSHILRLQILDSAYQLTFIVMPYYKNGSLANYLHNHKTLSNRQKYQLILQCAYLIADLHQQGWLHNDIKPSNILLENFAPNDAENSNLTPRLLLTDFALAQRFDNIRSDTPAGTPAYLAPERWQGQGATVQSDVYAFGVMMVEIIMGNRPFSINKNSQNQAQAWAVQHCQSLTPKLFKEFAHYQSIVNRALAKRIEKRYKNTDEILLDLAKITRE